MTALRQAEIPLLLKLAMTLFVSVLIPVYYENYGLLHFLWLSDVALFLTLAALWRESPLLNSMLCVGALPFELLWFIDFVVRAIMGTTFIGITDYMFDEELSLFLRGVSLFHVVLPVIWIWLLFHWGYDRRALLPQAILMMSLILATALFTEPEKNINMVFSPRFYDLHWMPQWLWFVLLLAGIPLFCYWPLHRLLRRRFPSPPR